MAQGRVSVNAGVSGSQDTYMNTTTGGGRINLFPVSRRNASYDQDPHHRRRAAGSSLIIFSSMEMSFARILTDNGTEYFVRVEALDFELYPGINDIERT